MKLSKFFRRYSRVLLMVFMSLLLVVFLLGDVLQNAGQKLAHRETKLGHAFGHEVTSVDYKNAQAMQGLLLELGFSTAKYPLRNDPRLQLDPLDVYLLLEESHRLGIRVGQDEGQLAVSQVLGDMAEQRLTELQQRYHRPYSWMYGIAAQWIAVLQLPALQADALGGSLPRAELAFRDQQQQANVNLAVVDAKGLVSFVPEPAEADLQAFFEECKNRKTKLTEDEMQFGYLQPQRVELEYLTIDPRKNERKIRVRESDMKTFFEAHRQNYQKSVAPATQASQPAAPATKIPMTYEEARERVREDVRIDMAIKEAQRAVNEIREAAYQPWKLQPEENGFHVPPAPDAVVSFEALRDKFSDRFDVTYDRLPLLDENELSERFETVPAALQQYLRRSTEPTYREGNNQLTLAQLAFRVKGLFTPESKDTLPVLNLMEPSPVLTRHDQNPGTKQTGPYQLFFFRVVRAEPEGPPAALDVVRDQLTKDYQLLKAFEMAGTYAKQIGERARTVGLTKAVAEATELKERLEKEAAAERPAVPVAPEAVPPAPKYVEDLGPSQRPLTRTGSAGSGLEDTEKVQNEVFALASSSSASAPAHRVAVVPVDNVYRWAVVELEQVKPLYEAEFDQQRTSLLQSSAGEDRGAIFVSWFIPDNIRKRANFVPAPGMANREASEE